MQALSNSTKLEVFIAPKMTDIITFLDPNRRLSVYIGVNIHGLNCYLEIIGSPNILTTSGQLSRHFGPLFYTNNDIETLQPVIADLYVQQKTIFGFCGIIGHKADGLITDKTSHLSHNC